MKKLVLLLLIVVSAALLGATAPAQNGNPCRPCASGYPNRVVFFAYKWRKVETPVVNGISSATPWNGFVKLCDRDSAPGWAVLGAAIYPEWMIAEETFFMSKQ